jgi:hypothetical protein
MLRATEVGLARVSEPAAANGFAVADENRETDETLANGEPGSARLDIASRPNEFEIGRLPARFAEALQERDEDTSGVAIQIDANIAPPVSAFVREL